jgi:hypothetical protein
VTWGGDWLPVSSEDWLASSTMNQFQAAWGKLAEEKDATVQIGKSARQNGREKVQESLSGDSKEEDDTTVKTASAISEGIFDHHLTKSEKKVAGPTVHYALGTADCIFILRSRESDFAVSDMGVNSQVIITNPLGTCKAEGNPASGSVC